MKRTIACECGGMDIPDPVGLWLMCSGGLTFAITLIVMCL